MGKHSDHHMFTDMDSWAGPTTPRHRRVVLTKPVSLKKRTVPNTDTLIRSGL